jgi:hypothetical protein
VCPSASCNTTIGRARRRAGTDDTSPCACHPGKADCARTCRSRDRDGVRRTRPRALSIGRWSLEKAVWSGRGLRRIGIPLWCCGSSVASSWSFLAPSIARLAGEWGFRVIRDTTLLVGHSDCQRPFLGIVVPASEQEVGWVSLAAPAALASSAENARIPTCGPGAVPADQGQVGIGV